MAADADPNEPVLPAKNRRVVIKRDSKTQTFYANNVQVEASNLDVVLRFGLIQSSSPDLIEVRDVAHVYLTHEQAVSFETALKVILGKIAAFKERTAEAAKALHENKE